MRRITFLWILRYKRITGNWSIVWQKEQEYIYIYVAIYYMCAICCIIFYQENVDVLVVCSALWSIIMSEREGSTLRFCVTHRGRETDRITTKKIWTFLGDKFNFFAIWRSSLKIVMNTFRNRRIDLLLASNKSVIVLCHSLLPIFELLIDVFDVGEKIEENVMCEPARKLIRLTSLTEFTMSKGKAYNRASLYRPYIFVWDEIDTRRSPVWKDRTFGMASLFHNVFFFFFCGLFCLSLCTQRIWLVCKSSCVSSRFPASNQAQQFEGTVSQGYPPTPDNTYS